MAPQLAYLDPGSGSMIVQVVVGIIAGIGAVLAAFRHRIAGLFGRRKGAPADATTQEAVPSQEHTG